jgi:2-keto-4-pentenoate hydratase/2-oxohepta-3-ene-1,7-dioic acid hydratase in catechol pathway
VKLLAFTPAPTSEGSPVGPPRLGVATPAGIRDLAPFGYRDLREVIEAGDGGLAEISRRLERGEGPTLDPAEVIPRAPLRHGGKIVCIGLNYRDHCAEQGIDPPAYPRLFAKLPNAVNDPGAPVVRPRATEKLDLECELAVVIGRPASHLAPDEAMGAVYGYTILNDVTMRDLQAEDRQWLRAKGTDGFAPMGPVLVTRDEIADPHRLRIGSSVNGERWQESTTAEMVFGVPQLIAFVSRFIRLEAGDLIATGTPAGVGHYHHPPRYCSGGDVMRCEIEGIGALENPVIDEEPRAGDHASAAGVGMLASTGADR